jgi:hypothetical protein
MENKYYTPALEEFHVGFEFEVKVSSIWATNVVSPEHGLLTYATNLEKFRVKYLDKEDIESLGGKENAWSGVDSQWKQYDFGHLLLSHGGMSHYKISVPSAGEHTNKGFMHRWVFKGIIKNKSELKKILTQIGYNDK